MLRIVLDVNEGVSYSVVTKQPSKEVKIDLLSPVKTSLNKAAVNKVALKINDDNIVVKTTVKTILNTKIFYRTKPMVVVIDAGHGGKDPGAIGQYGTREKDVVLSIARMLANLVNEQPKMRAVLTRDGDYFISLRKRLEITRRSKADLFIAIHADSYFNNRASGASVYSLSNHGASSVAARWLAQRENHSELGGVDLAGLEDQSVILRSVLLDLAQTATNQASLRCGRGLLDALSDVTRLHYARVEQAPFMVLKSPDIPSILVETGFISNVKEEYRLRDKSHQYKVALALFEGVHDFQQKYLVKEV
jgi:N-acetylmuramoyl-L-alanine amidase